METFRTAGIKAAWNEAIRGIAIIESRILSSVYFFIIISEK